MPKRKAISTSTDAYKSLHQPTVREMYTKIVEAIQAIGPSTYEQIADHLGEKPERVWKRMDEARKLNLVHRPGERRVMKSGRQGFVWAIGSTPEPIKKKERVMKGPSVSDRSKDINKIQKQVISEVKQLF